jgi:hypothetical protein
VVINQSMASKFFPNENPLGKRKTIGKILGPACDSRRGGLPTLYVWLQLTTLSDIVHAADSSIAAAETAR